MLMASRKTKMEQKWKLLFALRCVRFICIFCGAWVQVFCGFYTRAQYKGGEWQRPEHANTEHWVCKAIKPNSNALHELPYVRRLWLQQQDKEKNNKNITYNKFSLNFETIWVLCLCVPYSITEWDVCIPSRATLQVTSVSNDNRVHL